eukprot:g9440.t1
MNEHQADLVANNMLIAFQEDEDHVSAERLARGLLGNKRQRKDSNKEYVPGDSISDLFTRDMLNEINSYESEDSEDSYAYIDDIDEDDIILVDHHSQQESDESDSDETDHNGNTNNGNEQPIHQNRIQKEKLKRRIASYEFRKKESQELILFHDLVDKIHLHYTDEIKLKHDCLLHLGGQFGVTTCNKLQNKFICNKRPCKGGFTICKKQDPRTNAVNYMLKSIRKHTCDQLPFDGVKRSQNFPMKPADIIKYIDTVVFKNPIVSVPDLLTMLSSPGLVGKLFAEESRMACGTRAKGYNCVYKAREMLRQKYCGSNDNLDYGMLPSLKAYFTKLDADNIFEIKVDSNNNNNRRPAS